MVFRFNGELVELLAGILRLRLANNAGEQDESRRESQKLTS